MSIYQTLKLKPLSINEAWQGRRFKTHKYTQFEKDFLKLVKKESPYPKGTPLSVTVEFYLFNHKMSDIDNPIKPLLDCLQKANIIANDKDIISLSVSKYKAEKKEDQRLVFLINEA